MIPADSFIGIAEEAGLIIPIGDFVLQQALTDMVGWLTMATALMLKHHTPSRTVT
jgi:EAL domain-containing protein (putative c-di-GMP-specific phosphodiesterase class I)